MLKYSFLLFAGFILLMSCSKQQDATVDDGIFDRLYCNDPEAVNYNRDFPGTPDNSTCFYPKDLFEGTYIFKDTIYNAEYERDTILDYNITIHAQSNTLLKLTGFCSQDSVTFIADRFYKATVDSTTFQDSNKIAGQILCRSTDTLTGIITTEESDNTKIRIVWAIASDTGLNYHNGTATKQ